MSLLVVDVAAYILVVLGMLSLSTAVYGIIWMPGVYVKIHAASLTAVGGVFPILLGLAILSGEAFMIARAILIGCLLFLTVPVSSQAMGAAAHSGDRQ